jgi:uncharacterized protein
MNDEQTQPEVKQSRIHLRGFATMKKVAPERFKAITSEAGKRSQQLGVGHKFTSEEARAAGRKGGLAKAAKAKVAA